MFGIIGAVWSTVSDPYQCLVLYTVMYTVVQQPIWYTFMRRVKSSEMKTLTKLELKSYQLILLSVCVNLADKFYLQENEILRKCLMLAAGVCLFSYALSHRVVRYYFRNNRSVMYSCIMAMVFTLVLPCLLWNEPRQFLRFYPLMLLQFTINLSLLIPNSYLGLLKDKGQLELFLHRLTEAAKPRWLCVFYAYLRIVGTILLIIDAVHLAALTAATDQATLDDLQAKKATMSAMLAFLILFNAFSYYRTRRMASRIELTSFDEAKIGKDEDANYNSASYV